MTTYFTDIDFKDFDFNSHAHVERDYIASVVNFNSEHFNSHAHVERDGSGLLSNGMAIQFQLTRSRGA